MQFLEIMILKGHVQQPWIHQKFHSFDSPKNHCTLNPINDSLITNSYLNVRHLAF